MAATSGLKTAVGRVSCKKDQPFKDKPVALQLAAAAGILGGSRAQYHLRQCLTSIDAIPLGRPEAIVTFAPQKFDEKTPELEESDRDRPDQTAARGLREACPAGGRKGLAAWEG